jgi:hypothetical protein
MVVASLWISTASKNLFVLKTVDNRRPSGQDPRSWNNEEHKTAASAQENEVLPRFPSPSSFPWE